MSRENKPLNYIHLKPGTTTIGRAPDNDTRVSDNMVSALHAKIVSYFDAAYVEDLGSTNGTYVNGRKVNKTPIYPGDILKVGDTCFVVKEKTSSRLSNAPTGRSRDVPNKKVRPVGFQFDD